MNSEQRSSERRDFVYPMFLRAVEATDLLPKGTRVRVAFSGGPDSTALLYLFARWQERRRPDLELSAGHIHHGLRGAEADADANHCAALARDLALPFTTCRADARRLAQQRGLSIETAAREIRLSEYQRWHEEDGIEVVALGHHADDQVETVLAHLVRGSGLAGLCGIPKARPIVMEPGSSSTVTDHPGRGYLFRPLLDIRRADLERFLEPIGVSARQDSSNRDLSHRRNRIRQLVLPLLREQLNPGVERAILGLTDEMAELFQWRSQLLDQYLSHFRFGDGAVAVDRSTLPGTEQRALLAPLLDRIWTRATGSPTGLLRDHHDAWCALADATTDGNRYSLPGGWRLERAARQLYLYQPRAQPIWNQGDSPEAISLRLPEWGLTLCIRAITQRAPAKPGEAEIPGLPTEITFRRAKKSDRMAMETGHASVVEVLRAHGLPHSLRAAYPIAASTASPGDEVLWVPGLKSTAISSGARCAASVEVDPTASPEAFIIDHVLRRASKEQA